MKLQPVKPGAAPALGDEVADVTQEAGDAEVRKHIAKIGERMDELQTALYAEGKQALLIVLQARDGAGKDSTIRRVFGRLNPVGCMVTSFKVPTALELRHDFLWRVHQAVPPKGTIGVFNRSHYEDVLVVRVHQLVPEKVWRARYDQINAFEHLLTQNGVTILKFFLHISKDEQKERLRERLDDPAKQWKFNAADLGERDKWDEYTHAYTDVLRLTSTPEAPWYVVPADKKLPRDAMIAEVVVEALERMDPRFPGPPEGLEEFRRLLS
ncbi:MAG TPA: PPK2 family polyphosphate kinase [Gemmatimonadales bacterium]|jgi:PPK2 family polyphosphate:nucleotide phosphotransferase